MRQTLTQEARPAVKHKSQAARFTVSGATHPGPLLQRKACACGGTCPRCHRELPMQTGLTISQPGDRLEQEADRVASDVMRLPDAPAPRHALSVAPMVQRRGDDRSGVDDAPPIVDDVLASTGQPLAESTRQFFETRLGDDLGRVRVHDNALAAESADAVRARAYTVDNDVVFAAGEHAPHTDAGRRLLAHELVHVIQQRQFGAPTGAMLQRSLTFTNCRTASEAADDPPESASTEAADDPRENAITEAAGKAVTLASGALSALKQPIGVFPQAIQAHFGTLTDTQAQIVKERYAAIVKNMDDKTIECKAACPNPKEKRDNCAEAVTPGNTIYVCPKFESKESCGDPAVTLVHEAAHNEGATLDVDLGAGYPPDAAEDNSYSYEHFATEAAKGPLGTVGPILRPPATDP